MIPRYAYAPGDESKQRFRLCESDGSPRTLDELRQIAHDASPARNRDRAIIEAWPKIAKNIRAAFRAHGVANSEIPPILLANPKRSARVSEAAAGLIREESRRIVSAEVAEKIEAALALVGGDDFHAETAIKALESAKAAARSCPLAKVIEGNRYPRHAFAQVGDKNDPDTWDLRVLDESGMVDSKAMAGVIEALRQRVTSKDKAAGDIHRNLCRIAEHGGTTKRRPIAESVLIGEAKITPEKIRETGIVPIVLIQPGLNSSGSRIYPRETLARAAAMFNDQKMYINHASWEEDDARPEGDLNNWAGVTRKVRAGKSGELIGEAVIIDPVWLEKVATIAEKGQLSHLGVSIRAFADGEFIETDEGDIVFRVDEFVHVRSVDWVTEPGAGGGVIFESAAPFDLDAASADIIRQRRPDVTEAIEARARAEQEKTDMDKFEELQREFSEFKSRFEKAEESHAAEVKALKEENETLKAAAAEHEKAQKIAECAVAVDKALENAQLPEPAKKRVRESYAGKAEADGIEDAIKSEQAYLTEAGLPEPQVTGLDPSGASDGGGMEGKNELIETYAEDFIRRGYSPEEAKLKARDHVERVTESYSAAS